jgi:putative transposase
MCKYHIEFKPKYKRKIVSLQYRESIVEIIKDLCLWKGVESIEGSAMMDHIYLIVSIPPKHSVSGIMGYLTGNSALMIFDRHANLKYKFGNRHFRSRGCYVRPVGLSEAAIAKCMRKQ